MRFVAVADATKWAGEETVAFGAGYEIVTPAKADDAVHAIAMHTTKRNNRRAVAAVYMFQGSPFVDRVSRN